MRRLVEPELLDTLPPGDPQAVGSRADLRRLNFFMGHADILTRAFRRPHEAHPFPSRPLRLVELGAGDGSLLLRLAQRWSVLGVTAEVTLLDRQNLASTETRRAFAALHWSVKSVASDVFAWLDSPAPIADVMLANLFLHHFPDERLATLLRLAAARTNMFLACEPRRSPLALTAARSVALLGCNAVTRHDAVVSVRAGFAGPELSALWPQPKEWELNEKSVGLFSHGFFAQRNV
ncbi:MAG: methyltransferase domain-containing protein [Verrucomicrobia bacterium]|nr:methyltransferase domain-containing protein [Verrucomicrobiota bacterium]